MELFYTVIGYVLFLIAIVCFFKKKFTYGLITLSMYPIFLNIFKYKEFPAIFIFSHIMILVFFCIMIYAVILNRK